MFKLIIIDDEPLMREYIKTNIPLINENWTVAAEAMDGDEALKIIESDNFDLILTDIKMPVMDGLELCRVIHDKNPKQKIVILSGYDDFSFAKQAMHYGVSEYLLKPIVREELESVLQRITAWIESERKKQLSEEAIKALSESSRKQAIKNFLKAVILNSDIEIKALYPLIYRLKLNLIESEGTIMILSLDEEMMLEKQISVNEIPVFKFMLNQITTEIIDINENAKVFNDMEQNTAILVTGESENELLDECCKIFSKISNVMHSKSGITVSAAVGSSVNDVLQLNISYVKARQALLNRLKHGGNSIYIYETASKTSDYISNLEKVISSIKSSVLDNDEVGYCMSVNDYVRLIEDLSVLSIYRHGIYLISKISELGQTYPLDSTCSALRMLSGFHPFSKGKALRSDVAEAYKKIVKNFMDNNMQKQSALSDDDIIAKAKEYIYNHYFEPISLALIAEEINISSSYLSSIFHKSVGSSYIKFITRIRMEEAAKLLRTRPNETVYNIAEKVGYISPKHFSYIFKKHFGMTPGEYQQKYTSGH